MKCHQKEPVTTTLSQKCKVAHRGLAWRENLYVGDTFLRGSETRPPLVILYRRRVIMFLLKENSRLLTS
jgi:hypothetical protein